MLILPPVQVHKNRRLAPIDIPGRNKIVYLVADFTTTTEVVMCELNGEFLLRM